jgi:hypothetical protein
MRVKYIGKNKVTNPYLGKLIPGEVREISDEIGKEMIMGRYFIETDEYQLPMIIKIKKECPKCPKKESE